ncbi:hypothetical protein KVP10_17040 [Candidimonas humi]|jgi:hypothetical protein|uniref:DUF4148 domain-containing protein n=1 Tax=Candidimonas humi TaxID=683355 RepID=A0ABV8P2G4_9BURK|nr:hypothetical protein [Candidimonas humi]MBV6306598.1 hypothetical protein [Candidimonas humi]
MKKLHVTLFAAAMFAGALASAQAAESKTSHEAWLAAQKIDVPPTLKVTETKIPAGEAANMHYHAPRPIPESAVSQDSAPTHGRAPMGAVKKHKHWN